MYAEIKTLARGSWSCMTGLETVERKNSIKEGCIEVAKLAGWKEVQSEELCINLFH